jgi:hypothetical protein
VPAPLKAPLARVKSAPKRLWITLGVVAALLVVVGGGAAYGIAQYKAPADAATAFCGHLKAQRYAAAYGLLSATLRAQLTQNQYTQASTTLDTLQGKVTACGQAATDNAYSYRLGASTATVNSVITRAKAGNFQGAVYLVSEHGAWKVERLDTALVGVNFGALLAAGTFCQDMATQNYTGAYGLLASAARAHAKASDFAAQAALQDLVDGKVTACALASLGKGNTETSASLTVSLTRAKLGQRQGDLSLTKESGVWKVAKVDQRIQGTDITGLAVAARFCADVTKGDYADAYTLASPRFRGSQTAAQFAADFTFTDQGQQIKVVGMKADPASYKVTGTSAQIQITITYELGSSGNQAAAPATLKLAQASSGTWQIDDLG